MNHKQPTSTAVKTAEEYYLLAIKQLGFENYKHSEMSNSDNHLCTIYAMKLYANAKLDEAADNSGVKMTRDIPIGQRYMWNHRTDCHYSVNKETILSLKDEI